MVDLSSSFFVCLPGRVLITEPFPMTPPISWDKGRLSDFVSEFTGIARDLWRIAEVNRSPYRASENSPQSQIITQNLSYPIIILVLFHHVPMKIQGNIPLKSQYSIIIHVFSSPQARSPWFFALLPRSIVGPLRDFRESLAGQGRNNHGDLWEFPWGIPNSQ